MQKQVLTPGPNDFGKRIDRILRVHFSGAGLGRLFAALRRGDIRVNGLRVRQDYRIREGDSITVKGAFSPEEAEPPNGGAPDALRPLILLEDEDYLVINKPRGALVHGPGALDSRVRNYLAPRLPPSLAFSPGPLHRLDRNTTGVLFFSRSIRGARVFSEALRSGKTRKKYLALLEGDVRSREIWRDDLSRNEKGRKTRTASPGEPGKSAETRVSPLARAGGYTLCEIHIRTGRTHQIRAQAAARGHPLAGDRKYDGHPLRGGPHGGGYILHAAEFSLMEGEDAGARVVLTVTAPQPPEVEEFLFRLFGKS